MNSRHRISQRNLAILNYMGLACQLAGVLVTFGGLAGWLAGLWGPPAFALGGVLFFVFGMALGGWASNLSLINNLKERLSALEARLSTESDSR